ncbi:MAG: ABC transporter substrate-binding protein [Nitrospinae bacterium CG11_big_fil_rev_8_21_14_0_20_45_15]|nr:MAG: ABC transporter substrate-binding protein [Nitrospinae bacterium CG11_big_fil_rev_8_21_14_0_20_45_15]
MVKTRSIIRTLCLSLALLLAGGAVGLVEAGEKQHVIKFATLAPEGSSWMKQMRELAREVSEKTQGQVEFKFYPGGVSGDEKDVIRKIRIGQLHSAGFTGVGLGDILPEVRVLDLPFLFETDEEVAYVYDAMDEYFMRAFEDKGYVLLGWVPVGWVHFFSVPKIESIEDLQRSRPWLWAGDPLVESAYQAMDVNPVPLALPDVLMSLQTGMVDVVYGSPQGTLALQWFSRVKHMTSFRMGYATGGVLISKRKFNQLPEDVQSVFKSTAKNHLNKLMKIIQSENMESIQIMKENGVTLTPELSKNAKSGFLQAGVKARDQLTGKLFSIELLKKVESFIAEVRK